MKQLWKRIKKDKKSIMIGLGSVIALLLGSFIIGFVPSILTVTIIDIIIFIVSKPKKGKRNPKETWKTFLLVTFSCAIFVLLLGIAFCLYIVFTAKDFNPEKLANKEASILYSKDGSEIAKLGEEIRQVITYDDMSQSLIDAVVATEDARFFQHSGVDLPRFMKASVSQLLGKGGGGASTITMQVSKQTQTSTEDSGLEGIIRKFTDVYMSVFQIETRYTKEQILEFYLNYNNMGGTIRGVEQASLSYFGKHASEINVAEAAMLAGLFQSPNGYNPYKHPEECEKRRQEVLSLMLRHGYIDQTEYEIAKELSVDKLLQTTTSTTSNQYQDFIDTVVSEVIDRTGLNPNEVSMKIYTSMDKTMQENMDSVMSGANFKWPDDNIQGGSVVMDVKTGEIVAVGGGHNRQSGNWNFATDNNRQIGSTAKPLFDYGPGIEFNNWSTYTGFTDEPYSYSDGKKVNNWDKKYFGYSSLHDVLKYSRNIPAIKAFQQLDNKKVEKFVKDLGLHPESSPMHETHAIGGYNGESPLSVSAAYAAFSNGGYYIEPHSYTKLIINETGETKEVKPVTRRVMSEETAYMITKVLEDTSSYAVGLSVNGVNYCSKTGTTDISSDIAHKLGLNGYINDKWIASYNDSYSIAVWLGYHENNKETYKASSFNSIKTLFQAIAKGVYTKNSSWAKPDDVVEIEVEGELPDAKLASAYTPTDLRVKALFKKGFEPTEESERFSQLANVTNLDYNEKTGVLTWKAVDTPKFIDRNYLYNMFDNMYTNDEYRDSALNERLAYNNSYIGTITYEVYSKDSSGKLTLLTTTTDTTYTYKGSGKTTLVVKTAYTIFKNNRSSGAEFTVEGGSVTAPIVAQLSGKSVIDLKVGDTYTEPDKPVIVLENGATDITDDCIIHFSILRNSDKQLFSNFNYIDTLKEDSYTVTYSIKHGEFSTTLTKVINITQ